MTGLSKELVRGNAKVRSDIGHKPKTAENKDHCQGALEWYTKRHAASLQMRKDTCTIKVDNWVRPHENMFFNSKKNLGMEAWMQAWIQA